MRICTYYFSQDKTAIKMSDAFWELDPVTQLDALKDIAYDAMKVYEDHLAIWRERQGKKIAPYLPQIDCETA